ncbi:WD40 repeat domain-containing protein [Streptomyces flavofungini]|uniref:WD40 repeat domain-containing protein n=1 Tax=Streptomyces flavofungini TaxID=68200 RepID=UPI0025B04373|nr:WD40 repeat domain-containing protein [Streptomyces flavofungini]WJV49521.1 WD40 repeat domain-containing protein [Streptomyces flavofungini]
MNVDQLVREALQEQAAEQGGPRGDLAGRVLATRRRRRARTIAGAALGTAAAVVVGVTALDSGNEDAPPASASRTADVIARPGQSVPRDFVAAGKTGLAGYSVSRDVPQRNGDQLLVRSYFLLNPTTMKYEKADAKWAWVAVAPGMRTAAVLEGELPARRVGMLDLRTGRVTRWITLAHGVAGVEWSPDGKRLVATAYRKNPDRKVAVPGNSSVGWPKHHGSRTGYVLIEADSGKVGPFRDVPQPDPDKEGMFPGVSRQDLHFNQDGTRLYVQQYARQGKKDYRDWYTLSGRPTTAPAAEKHAGRPEAGLSPDGRYLADDGNAKGSAIRDPRTGEQVARVPSSEQLAWADSKRLVALACDPARCTGKDADRKRLVLVTVGSEKTVPLTAVRTAPQGYKRVWTPMLTAR